MNWIEKAEDLMGKNFWWWAFGFMSATAEFQAISIYILWMMTPFIRTLI